MAVDPRGVHHLLNKPPDKLTDEEFSDLYDMYWDAREALTEHAAYGAGDSENDQEAQYDQNVVTMFEENHVPGVWDQKTEDGFREWQIDYYDEARRQRGGTTAEEDVAAGISRARNELANQATGGHRWSEEIADDLEGYDFMRTLGRLKIQRGSPQTKMWGKLPPLAEGEIAKYMANSALPTPVGDAMGQGPWVTGWERVAPYVGQEEYGHPYYEQAMQWQEEKARNKLADEWVHTQTPSPPGAIK